MRHRILSLLILIVMLLPALGAAEVVSAAPAPVGSGGSCTTAMWDQERNATFFGLPTWYRYLNGEDDGLGGCTVSLDLKNSPNDLWAIAMALLDILLRLAGILAVIYIAIAGFSYVTSQGEPDKTRAARSRILNALIGLVIALVSTGIVQFLGDRIL